MNDNTNLGGPSLVAFLDRIGLPQAARDALSRSIESFSIPRAHRRRIALLSLLPEAEGLILAVLAHFPVSLC